MSRPSFCLRALVLAVVLSANAAWAADASLTQAQEMLAKGDGKAAYALLEPMEPERAGDPEFDYLLGVAALDAGFPARAVFALERVLAVKPDHVQARAEIGRAYFLLGETETARNELQSVAKEGVPVEVNAAIQRYLAAIESVEKVGKPSVTGYLEATLGYDSNVNSATSLSQVAIPVLGGAVVTLNQGGVEAHDSFLSLAGGISARRPLSPQWAVLAGVDGQQRLNGSEDRFDTGTLNGYVGTQWSRGRHTATVAVQAQSFSVDNSRYRDALGVTGQWEFLPDENNAWSVYVQHHKLDYPGQDVRDADRTVVGGSYGHAFGGARTPVIFASVYAGEERERRGGVPHLGHDLWGGRLGGQLTLNPKTLLLASVGYEERDYGGRDPFFLVSRRDKQMDVRVGVAYMPVKNWRVTPQLLYTDNDSNTAITDYSRYQFLVSVRRDFK